MSTERIPLTIIGGCPDAGKTTLLILLVMSLSLLLTACRDDLFIPATGEAALVDRVDVITTGAQPPQYFAIVAGHFPDSCTQLDRPQQQQYGNTIKITLTTSQVAGDDCSPVSTPFEETIQLKVTGLSAGSYGVEVNGVTTSFILTEDHD